jgi:hypothetical protein
MSPRRLPTMVRTLREPRGMTQFALARKANVVAQGYLGDLGKAELARSLERGQGQRRGAAAEGT